MLRRSSIFRALFSWLTAIVMLSACATGFGQSCGLEVGHVRDGHGEVVRSSVLKGAIFLGNSAAVKPAPARETQRDVPVTFVFARSAVLSAPATHALSALRVVSTVPRFLPVSLVGTVELRV